jgi:hypothetical protein
VTDELSRRRRRRQQPIDPGACGIRPVRNPAMPAEPTIRNARFTTLDPARPGAAFRGVSGRSGFAY